MTKLEQDLLTALECIIQSGAISGADHTNLCSCSGCKIRQIYKHALIVRAEDIADRQREQHIQNLVVRDYYNDMGKSFPSSIDEDRTTRGGLC